MILNSGGPRFLFVACSLLIAFLPPMSGAQARRQTQIRVAKTDQAVLAKISANSMHGHLSFLASDLLQGRDSPSPGLDIAAEYIAAQFRRAGLETLGDDGYFQTSTVVEVDQQPGAFSLKFNLQGREVNVPPDQVSTVSVKPLNISHAKLFKINLENPTAFTSIVADQIHGQAILTEQPRAGWGHFAENLNALKPSVIIIIDRDMIKGPAVAKRRLTDPYDRKRKAIFDASVVFINNPDVIEMFDVAAPGTMNVTLSLQTQSTLERQVRLRNVAGLLRGSDELLKDTYILVTAHYDHLGVDTEGRIYNGANDNGSGAVAVIELASALSERTPRPKRSLVFIAFYGEEKGEIGSQYYVEHPLVPLSKTIANVNLEQLGRTDSLEGPVHAGATLTGFDFSDMTATFQAAGRITGIRIYKHELFSDRYFLRSDNGPFAKTGIPAHTVGVLFQFPDYHGLGDKTTKIDYHNMARVTRMLAIGVISLANAPTIPKWNEQNPRTAPYVKAWRRLHQPL